MASVQAGFDVYSDEVPGLALERWFLKTLVNSEMMGEQGLPVGDVRARHGEPSEMLVDIAFGKTPWPGRSGLFSAIWESGPIVFQDRITYHSWLRGASSAQYVAAGAFRFFGFYFILCLEPEGLPDGIDTDHGILRLTRRKPLITAFTGGKASYEVRFRW